MHDGVPIKMRAIATDVPVAWCVCLLRAWALQKQLTERIDVLFGVETRSCDPRNIVLDGVQIPYGNGGSHENFERFILGLVLTANHEMHKFDIFKS